MARRKSSDELARNIAAPWNRCRAGNIGDDQIEAALHGPRLGKRDRRTRAGGARRQVGHAARVAVMGNHPCGARRGKRQRLAAPARAEVQDLRPVQPPARIDEHRLGGPHLLRDLAAQGAGMHVGVQDDQDRGDDQRGDSHIESQHGGEHQQGREFGGLHGAHCTYINNTLAVQFL